MMVWIKNDNPNAFRSGQWGQVIGVGVARLRPCYLVRWHRADALPKEDYWPIEHDTYELAVGDEAPS